MQQQAQLRASAALTRTLPGGDRKKAAAKWIALFANFPQSHVNAFLNDLHFTRWRVACFSGRCENASMWDTYGQVIVALH